MVILLRVLRMIFLLFLTKHDIEICCLLRFGIEHEVLGSIFLTETDSVTKAKRRMKKRLNLSASDDLDVFLLKY